MSERDDALYIQHLEAQVAKLQQEIERLKKEKGFSSERDGLAFNKKTGTYEDANGLHHCPKCLAKKQRNPLTEDEEGWRCGVCDAYYYNPDAPPQPPLRIEPSSF